MANGVSKDLGDRGLREIFEKYFQKFRKGDRLGGARGRLGRPGAGLVKIFRACEKNFRERACSLADSCGVKKFLPAIILRKFLMNAYFTINFISDFQKIS